MNRTAASLLSAAAVRANNVGKMKLRGAHCYLMAAVLADFVKRAKQDDWIGPAVRMGESTVKSTEQFLMDHLFDSVFAPIHEMKGDKFLLEVRRKTEQLVGGRRTGIEGQQFD